MGIITGGFLILLTLLIILGGLYVCNYERAPLWERVQVLGVGWGMFIGVCIRLVGG